MSNKRSQDDSPLGPLKNESTRQRWELFHRAIAYAKESNVSAMQDDDPASANVKKTGPILTIVR